MPRSWHKNVIAVLLYVTAVTAFWAMAMAMLPIGVPSRIIAGLIISHLGMPREYWDMSIPVVALVVLGVLASPFLIFYMSRNRIWLIAAIVIAFAYAISVVGLIVWMFRFRLG